MLKKILGRTEAQPRPPSEPDQKRSVGARIRQLFRTPHKQPDLIGIGKRIQSYFENLVKGKDRTAEASRKTLEAVHGKDPSSDPHINVKQPARAKAPDFTRFNPASFRPAILPEPAQDSCDKVINCLPEGENFSETQLRVKAHILAAERIHKTVWKTFPAHDIDRNVSLGEGNDPGSVLETLGELSKLNLDEITKQSIEVLQESVAHYHSKY
jgi:hypothetical protein